MPELTAHVGRDLLGRRTHLVHLDSWSDWPPELPLANEHFCLLLAADGRDVHAEVISLLVTKALAAGCVYFCAWGPECEFVHDVFDETYLGDGSQPQQPTVMTTWHAERPLGEALDFISRDAIPAKPLQATCCDVVVAVLANPEWSALARRVLALSQ